MTILEFQKALKGRGFDPGRLDGVPGPDTRKGTRDFQTSAGLPVTGFADRATILALNVSPTGPVPALPALRGPIAPPWMAEAARHLGLQEVVGTRHNPTILAWLARLGASWRDDETAWCGTYVGYCLAATLPDEPLPANPFGARNWTKFGRRLDGPAAGAVAVFWRDRPDGWQGHVGFYLSQRADGDVLIRGGNQGNAVSDRYFPRARLLGFFWPKTYASPTGGRVVADTEAARSTTEA